ncbi:Melanopsin [Mactra antiquata]
MSTYDRFEFVTESPYLAIPSALIVGIASLIGTVGNLILIVVLATNKSLHNIDTIFVVNLVISDSYVVCIAGPLSIVAKIEGEQFFDRNPGLCQTIASLCTISCVTSLMTISAMSMNRYVFICAHEYYERIFKKWQSIAICACFYLVGGTLVMLNFAGVGDHGFDRKSVECIWDRMATYPYTVVFSIVLVWIPSLVTGICYLKIYLFVRSHRRRVKAHQGSTAQNSPFMKNIRLAKTLFVIYAVFITCWAPYALLIVLDSQDTYPHSVHVYITAFAHLHPSLNWFIYYITNRKFKNAYNNLFYKIKVYFHCAVDDDMMASEHTPTQPTVTSTAIQADASVDSVNEDSGSNMTDFTPKKQNLEQESQEINC